MGSCRPWLEGRLMPHTKYRVSRTALYTRTMALMAQLAKIMADIENE
jgi:hypothetical protein